MTTPVKNSLIADLLNQHRIAFIADWLAVLQDRFGMGENMARAMWMHAVRELPEWQYEMF